MIPLVIVLAFVAGVFKLHWSSVPIIAAIWVALLLMLGDQSVSPGEIAIGGALFGLLNAVPGYGLGAGMRHAITKVRDDVSAHLTETREAVARDSELEAVEEEPS